jgi:TolB protein
MGAERLTTGLEMLSASLSPDGRRLAYAKGRLVGNAWRVSILRDRAATWAEAEQLTFDQAHVEMLDVASDGQRFAVSSDRSGNADIWILPAAGGEMQPLATDPTPDWAPAWSPDGRALVFHAYRSGNRETWIQPVSGGPARQLTRGEAESVYPRWSPDRTKVAYQSRIAGSSNIWIIPVTGGAARKVGGDSFLDAAPDWSPDGQWLAFSSNRPRGQDHIWRIPATAGQPELVSKGPGSRPALVRRREMGVLPLDPGRCREDMGRFCRREGRAYDD